METYGRGYGSTEVQKYRSTAVQKYTQLKCKLVSIQSGLHKNFKDIIKIERRV
jgi:hypothetical protein